MPDINPILQAAEAARQQSFKAQAAGTETLSTRSALESAQAELQIDVGTQNQIIASAADAASLAEQQARIKVGNAFGINMNDQGQVITAAAARYHQADAEMRESLAEVNRKQQAGFFDNPIEYISNLFTINDDIDRYNNASLQRTDALQYIEGANRAGEAVAKTQAQFKETLSAGVLAANQKKIADTAQIAANEALIKAQAYNADAVQLAWNMTKDRLNIDFNVLEAKNKQEQLGLAMANYELHRQEFQWRKEAKEDSEAADEVYVDRMQKGLRVLYGENAPNLVASPKLAKQYLAMLKSNTPAGKEAMAAYMAGQSGVIAGQVSGTVDVVRSGVPVTFTPAQESVKQFLGSVVETAGASQEYQAAVASKDKAAIQAVIDKTAKKMVDGQLREIVPGDSRNMFNIGAINQIIQAPAVKSDPVVTQILAPATAAGARLDDPSQVFATVLQGVKDKKVNLLDAAMGLSAVYQVGVKTNLAAKNLTKFGITPAEAVSHSYNTRVQTNPGAIMGGSEIVNMADPNSVLRAMNKSLASSAKTEMMLATPPFMK